MELKDKTIGILMGMCFPMGIQIARGYHTRLLPVEALGTEYIIMSGPAGNDFGSVFSVTAAMQGTTSVRVELGNRTLDRSAR